MATVGRSVQFRGIKSAVNAYENKNIAKWGLFHNTQFLDKYDGTDIEEGKEHLLAFLNAIDANDGSMATYTLKVYDTSEKVTDKTRADGSFNFRLVNDLAESRAGAVGSIDQRLSGMEEKIELLEKIEQLLSGPAEEEKPTGVMGMLYTLLEHPHVQQAIAEKVSAFISGIFPTPGPQNMRVAGIGAAPETEGEKLQQAVQMLAAADPEIGTHLLQIATVAQNDPEKYKTLIGMLKLL